MEALQILNPLMHFFVVMSFFIKLTELIAHRSVPNGAQAPFLNHSVLEAEPPPHLGSRRGGGACGQVEQSLTAPLLTVMSEGGV